MNSWAKIITVLINLILTSVENLRAQFNGVENSYLGKETISWANFPLAIDWSTALRPSLATNSLKAEVAAAEGVGVAVGCTPPPSHGALWATEGEGGGDKQRWPMGGPDATQTRGVGDVTTSIGAELVRDNSYRSVQCILLIRPSILYDENCSYKQDGLIPYHSIITILGISCDHLRSGR